MPRVQGEIIAPPRKDGFCDFRAQSYTEPSGFRRREESTLQHESDFSNDKRERFSDDNGRTWGDWRNTYQEGFEKFGENEVLSWTVEARNPVWNHTVQIRMKRSFWEGHEKAYERYWNKAEAAFFDHAFIGVGKSAEEIADFSQITYESASAYDPNNPFHPSFLHRNNILTTHVHVMPNGDIALPLEVPLETCCSLLGLDVGEVFPSCPAIVRGFMAAVGKWNENEGRYAFTFSRSVVIGDLQSSRGFHEPLIAQLASGRLLAVMRGSNVRRETWNTRIAPGAPAFKWFAYSDDGGKTFTQAAPWHFDNGEVVYSPATISYFHRSAKNGSLYWIGNITGPEAYGNDPRYPLQIVQVDEEHGTLLRETLVVIDTKRETDAPEVQLSNFSILENRETGDLEVYVSKICQFYHEGETWKSESWKYTIFFD